MFQSSFAQPTLPSFFIRPYRNTSLWPCLVFVRVSSSATVCLISYGISLSLLWLGLMRGGLSRAESGCKGAAQPMELSREVRLASTRTKQKYSRAYLLLKRKNGSNATAIFMMG